MRTYKQRQSGVLSTKQLKSVRPAYTPIERRITHTCTKPDCYYCEIMAHQQESTIKTFTNYAV